MEASMDASVAEHTNKLELINIPANLFWIDAELYITLNDPRFVEGLDISDAEKEELNLAMEDNLLLQSPRETGVHKELRILERTHLKSSQWNLSDKQQAEFFAYLDGKVALTSKSPTNDGQPRWVEALHYFNNAVKAAEEEAKNIPTTNQAFRESYSNRMGFYRTMIGVLTDSITSSPVVRQKYLEQLHQTAEIQFEQQFTLSGVDLLNKKRDMGNRVKEAIAAGIEQCRHDALKMGKAYDSGTSGEKSRLGARSPEQNYVQ